MILADSQFDFSRFTGWKPVPLKLAIQEEQILLILINISLHKATKIMEVDTEMFWQILELTRINVSCSGYPDREINY